jgi:predicted hydrocarbon binding protein
MTMTEEVYGTVERCRKKDFPFYYSSSAKTVHVVAKLRDSPGALASLLNNLGTRLDLIGTTSYGIEGGCAIFSCFGEALFDSDTVRSIQKVALRSPHVLACQVRRSEDGLLVDQFHQGIQSEKGESYIMMHRDGLASMFTAVRKALGSGGDVLLYMQGKSYGHSRVESCRSALGPNPVTRLQELAHIYEALGFGASLVTLQPNGTVKLVLSDDLECSASEGWGRSCHFARGFVEGSIGAALGKEMTADETKCRLRGDRNCEFSVIAKDIGPSTRPDAAA